MGDRDITLWIDEHKATAMDEALEARGTSLEKFMQDQLIDLYSEIVPTDWQAEVEAVIQKEREGELRHAEEARVVSAFRVTENGTEKCFKLEPGPELLSVADRLRIYLRREPGAPPDSFAGMFASRRTAITPDEFDELACVRMENAGKVAGVFEIDFDRQEFSAVHIMDGWKTFRIKDVSTAAYYAGKGAYSTGDHRLQILLERLDGKELRASDLPGQGLTM